MNISEQVVILSAERTGLERAENERRTEFLKGFITDINLPFEEAVGVYNGSYETSLVVLVRDQAEIDALKGFAFQNFDQESVLYTDANSEAYLLFNNGTSKQLGRLTQVPKEVALRQDSFTVLNGEYYITSQRVASKKN